MELNRPLTTVTPTLDGDILTILAKSDAAFTTGQLHRLLPQHSEEGIRKTLRRLTKQGIVGSDRVANAFSYRLNRKHLAAEHIIGLARLQETLLNRLEAHLATWENPPTYAAVFGSAAHGSMTVDSDLDLLLVRPNNTNDDCWDAQINELVSEVTHWIGNDTRPLQFTVDEITAHGNDEPVLRDMLNEGLTVAGTRDWLARQLRKKKG